MKNLAGDWPADCNVFIKKGWTGSSKAIGFQRSAFSFDYVPIADIRSAEIVTAENHMSVGRKLGWGIAGAVVLGPVGAIIGAVAGGNLKDQVVAVMFADGRKALLKGRKRELEPIIAAGFNWRGPPASPTA